MYLWSIALLVLLVVFSSATLRQFPYALIFAAAVCVIIEMVIRKYYLRQPFKMPFSGMITGLIIGCVAPIDVPLIPMLLACAIAILSKFFIKIKGSNVFNPATIGLFIGLGIFSVGSSWWATTSISLFGVAISLSVILIITSYIARRLVLSAAFIITLVLISFVLSPPPSVGNLEIALISVNYFFAFLMLAEPKTSPATKRAQAVYGVSVAIIYFILVIYTPQNPFWAQNVLFIALLLGNLIYALYRMWGHEIARKYFHD